MSLTVGVDIGGTKVAAGVVGPNGHVMERLVAPTGTAPGAAERAIERVVRQLAGRHDVAAVGVGAPGLVDETRSVVRLAPNLGWRDFPLRTQLEAATGLPVVLENDANAAAWGEVRFGAASGQRDVVVVTVGTGIGGGLVLDGRLYRGSGGMAAEIGHLVLVPDGRPCGCGLRGCWEQYASGSALLRDARAKAAEDREGAALLLALGDGTPEGVAGEHVTAAAGQGDRVALAAFAEVGDWLGRGLAEMVAVLDPALVVVGGGVSEAGELLVGPARQALRANLLGGADRRPPELVLATLGNDAGLVGAADLARR